jgi:hypothetical protein
VILKALHFVGNEILGVGESVCGQIFGDIKYKK